MESYDRFSKIAGIISAILLGIYFLTPSCDEKSSDETKTPMHYSWNNAVGDKVIVNLNSDGSGRMRMELAQTGSGLYEMAYGSNKEPIACSWQKINYSGGYIKITIPRQGDVWIKGGYVYTDYDDMLARDTQRAMKLN